MQFESQNIFKILIFFTIISNSRHRKRCHISSLFFTKLSPKMQPLATTRRVLTWLSICPADESCNERQKKAYVAHTLAVLFLNLIGFIGCLALCLKNVSIDFDDGMFALSGSITEFGVIYFLIAANLMRHQIDNIFTSLSTIYKSRKFDSIEFIRKAKICFFKISPMIII